MIRINCTPQKVPGFNKQRGKKLVLKCVARHPLTEYIAGVSQSMFCQWVKNAQHVVHQGHMPQKVLELPG
jgi:hypothetical protein